MLLKLLGTLRGPHLLFSGTIANYFLPPNRLDSVLKMICCMGKGGASHESDSYSEPQRIGVLKFPWVPGNLNP